MRKPRDIDAELQALAERTKSLKARKLVQLGELVVATGADQLSPEVLAGALLAAVQSKTPETLAQFGKQGAAFFQRQGDGQRPGGSPEGDRKGGAPGPGGAPAG